MVTVAHSRVPAPLTPEPFDVEAWVARLGASRSAADRERLERAVRFAIDAHAGQVRASGEPYVTHVLAVADILNDLQLDTSALVGGLLHDVVEDTAVTLEDVERLFGATVARLVDGVTKMHEIARIQGRVAREQAQAESVRKLLLAMVEDVRVVMIKLADRLHNMRTLGYLRPEQQERIARETLDIYAPLANRLGIGQIKWELEDLAFRYLNPQAYRDIAARLDERRIDRERYIERVCRRIREELSRVGIRAEVTGRAKHIYSIWRKMQRKNVSFDQIFDVRAVRIIVEKEVECYSALGVVHGLWHHIPKEFDDYIANPKENNYRSLHTAVVGPEGRTLEIQIRTREMHEQAELGVAAHWRYKEGVRGEDGMGRRIEWLRQLIEWKDEAPNATEFVDRFKSESQPDRIFVITPKGEVMDLPAGATVLDFAYYVHTEVGHRCRGAKVNGQIVPLTHVLRSGDLVEVLTTRHGRPSRDWLNPELGYLRTPRARAKARHWFRHLDFEKNVADGRLLLERELGRLGLRNLNWEQLAERMNFARVEDMLAALGRGDIHSSQLAQAAGELVSPREEAPELEVHPGTRPERSTGGEVRVLGVGNLLTHLARCCKPVPGDPIVGYITRGRGVTVHRRDCPNILRLGQEDRVRLIEVEWSRGEQRLYPVDIEIHAHDRPGLLRDIAGVFTAERANVLAVHTVTDRRTHQAHMQVTLEIPDAGRLSRILSRILQISNVIEARRRG
ncbi:MAG: GTP diphosphokinase [Gammaproteobacteria bacterium]|nr:MAG: GTP diphosphokinase [Gammaproteobacteria bacterium]